MRLNPPTSGRRPRKFPLTRIKLLIVAVGSAIVTLLGCLSGVTPQAGLAPMLAWMIGFTAEKSQATAMRITAAGSVACVAGALWRIYDIRAHGDISATRLLRSHLHAYSIPMSLLLFVAVTIGALLAIKLNAASKRTLSRRMFLFTGVCIGIFAASAATHSGDLSVNVRLMEITNPLGVVAIAAAAGVITQLFGLSSGVVIVPALFFLTQSSVADAVLSSLSVIAVATLLPLMSYTRRGLVDNAYAAAGMSAAIPAGAVAGWFLVFAPERLLLLFFAAMAMFYSAREISKIALEPPVVPPGPDLT